MARSGVTEAQVAAAADGLLLAGERPTIERVRAVLGTGSPNTLIRHLDAWWSGLGRRLKEKHCQIAMPEAPESVSDAASTLWRLALDHATQRVNADLDGQRRALDRERAEVDAERMAVVEAVEASNQRLAQSEKERVSALQRSEELERARGHLETVVSTLSATIESERAVAADHRARLYEAQQALDAARRQAILDRDEAQRHVQAVENRAHREVDRARQESAAASKRVAGLEKELVRMRDDAASRAEALAARVRQAETELTRLKKQSRGAGTRSGSKTPGRATPKSRSK